MAQQTAVEWLFSQIPFEWSSSRSAYEVLQQAKQMEKEQIIKGVLYGNNEPLMASQKMFAEQYYNETYNK